MCALVFYSADRHIVLHEMNDDRQSVQRFEFRPVIPTPSTNKTEGHIAASTEFNIKVLCIYMYICCTQINDARAIHVFAMQSAFALLVKSIIITKTLCMPFRFVRHVALVFRGNKTSFAGIMQSFSNRF